MSKRSYDESTRSAVMAALLEGQSISSVAREYNIPKGTVSHWKASAVAGVREEWTQKRDQASSSMGDLLLELLEKNVRSLIAISELTANQTWLEKQSAAEIATLFGVKHDKVIRMIEALNASDAEGS